jgi:hypothetical protein
MSRLQFMGRFALRESAHAIELNIDRVFRFARRLDCDDRYMMRVRWVTGSALDVDRTCPEA